MVKRNLIGRWRKTGRTLGQGGQGQVLLVVDSSESLAGEYALKWLSNEHRKSRIENEILTTKNLFVTGAPVLQVIDDYTVSDPEARHPWYVTPFVRGGNLRAKIQLGQCYGGSKESALEFFKKLVGAIKALHVRNVAHRDLKPENILLNEDGSVILCDLGLCLPLDLELHGTRLTESLERIGSLHYMPREAFSGPQPIGRNQFAYDVFATGKILYELSAGRPLPGFESPYKPEFDLAQVTGDSFYSSLNLLLEGLLHDNPEIRLDTWNNIEANIEALEEALSPKANEYDVTQLRQRLAVISDSLRRKDYQQSEKSSYDIEEIRRRCKEICKAVAESWKNNNLVKTILEEWVASNKQVAEAQINLENADLGSMLEGIYVYSVRGVQPLEDKGWSHQAEGKSEAIVGLKAKSESKMDSLWLACTIFSKGPQIVGMTMLIHQESGHRGKIDVLRDTISRRTGVLYDLGLHKGLLDDAESLASRWIDQVVKLMENLGGKD